MRSVICVAAVLLVVWAGSVCSALEHRCIHDELRRKWGFKSATARILPSPDAGQKVAYEAVAAFEPIRIKVYTNDLDSSTRYCTATGQLRSNFVNGNAACKPYHVLTLEGKNLLLNDLLPAAIKLHSERLSVEPMTGNMVLSKDTISGSACAYFTIPPDHFTTGASGGDMYIYVAAGPTRSGTVAWASTCAVSSTDGRPVAGSMNFSPQYISTKPEMIRTTAHEIAHALGFTDDMFTKKSLTTFVDSLRGKKDVKVISSVNTLTRAKAQYNCPSAPGMELEDEGGSATALSHWERRNAKDELMAGITGIGYYTALTMALFEDLGFYKANYSNAEPMEWGKDAGCAFLTNKCVDGGVSVNPEMFCTTMLDPSSTDLHCTSDRYSLGVCSTTIYKGSLLPQYQYFSNTSWGGRQGDLTDFCPVVVSYLNTGCVDGETVDMPGSIVGSASRCVTGYELHYKKKYVGDVCALISCDNQVLSIRYAGDPNFHLCPEGGSITPAPGTGFTGGGILCPKYSEVCTIPPSNIRGGSEGTNTLSVVLPLALLALTVAAL